MPLWSMVQRSAFVFAARRRSLRQRATTQRVLRTTEAAHVSFQSLIWINKGMQGAAVKSTAHPNRRKNPAALRRTDMSFEAASKERQRTKSSPLPVSDPAGLAAVAARPAWKAGPFARH